MAEFEHIFDEVGAFGPYQVRIFILVSFFETPAAWAMLLPVFTSANPKWTCGSDDDLMLNTSTLLYSNHSKSNNQTLLSTAHNATCTADNIICDDALFEDDFTSIASEWRLVCDQDYVPSLITSIQMIGVLVGACVTGQLADMFGRRKTLFINYVLLLIMWFITAFASSWPVFAALRFFVGTFFGGLMIVNFVLPLEFVGPRWRTFCGCIGFWAVGVMTLALWAYFIREWKTLTMVTSLSSLGLLGTWWFIPESARWLVQKGRYEEAEQILTELAAFNKKQVPGTSFSSLREYGKRHAESRHQSKNHSYWDLFRTKAMTKNTLIILYSWFVSGAVYYGLSFNVKNIAGDRYINFFLSGLVEIPALIFVVLVNNRIGRRKTTCFLMFTGGIGSFCILFVELAGSLETEPILVNALALVGKCGISGAWAAVQVFSAELFPTLVRNVGVGASSMSARVGLIVCPQIISLNQFSKVIPFTVFGALGLSCGLLNLLLPETVGQALPDAVPTSQWNSKDVQSHSIVDAHRVSNTTTSKEGLIDENHGHALLNRPGDIEEEEEHNTKL